MSYVIGIDGGGTKTVCVLADASGCLLARSVSGPGNYHKVGIKAARESFRSAIRDVCLQAGIRTRRFAAVCAGLAGVDRPRDRKIMRRVFASILRTRRLILESDSYITLVAATGGGPGVIVIGGTGSVAMGLNSKGERARAGGWGHILGDEGSGYDIGRLAIIAALKSYDGRGPKTALEETIFRALKARSTDRVISLVYNERMPPDRFAALFPVVVETAQCGDQLARDLLSYAGRELALTACAVIGRLGMRGESFPVCTYGGVFNDRCFLFPAFASEVKSFAPGAEITDPRHPPEMGALSLALASLKGRRIRMAKSGPAT